MGPKNPFKQVKDALGTPKQPPSTTSTTAKKSKAPTKKVAPMVKSAGSRGGAVSGNKKAKGV